jgi:glycosyltransferase involved in cell wall biosynthesis
MTTITEKKKVLIFSMAYFPRFVGGAEVAIKEITDRLGDQFEFHMITLRYDSNLPRVSRVGNVLVHRIGFSIAHPSIADLRRFPLRLLKPWYQLAAYVHARALHAQYHYDLVWSMMGHTAGVPGGLFKRFHPRVPYVLTIQEGDPPEHIERQMRIFGPLFPAGFTRADAVQTISNFLGAWAKRMGARNVVVVPNGVDFVRFMKVISPSRRAELRMRMRAKEDETLLITTSRLVPKNGIDTVIEALTLLPERVRFAVLGGGPEEHRLRTLVLDRGLDGRVTFLGEVPQEDLPDHLVSADIFIRASRSEGMGNSFIEAMAAGLPTVGTDAGGIPDFLTEGKTGFVCEPNNPQSVADAVRRVLENPTATQQIVTRAQELVRNQYDWGVVTKAMQKLFTSCLSVVR